MISVAIVCFNEANKLQKCLESTQHFAKELVVVDLGSSDNSVEIAGKYGAKVFHHQLVPFVESARDYAISKTSGDWVLVLDPDEVIPRLLADKLIKTVKQNDFAAVNIPRKNIFFGKWIRHTNWWPDRHIRFFKKGSVRWRDKIHSYPAVAGKILDLQALPDVAIWHYGYDSIHEFIDRQNRYSEIEAEQRFIEGERMNFWLFLWRPLREFLVRFIKHKGFLDGFYGFALTFLMMIYQIEVLVEMREKQKK